MKSEGVLKREKELKEQGVAVIMNPLLRIKFYGQQLTGEKLRTKVPIYGKIERYIIEYVDEVLDAAEKLPRSPKRGEPKPRHEDWKLFYETKYLPLWRSWRAATRLTLNLAALDFMVRGEALPEDTKLRNQKLNAWANAWLKEATQTESFRNLNRWRSWIQYRHGNPRTWSPNQNLLGKKAKPASTEAAEASAKALMRSSLVSALSYATSLPRTGGPNDDQGKSSRQRRQRDPRPHPEHTGQTGETS